MGTQHSVEKVVRQYQRQFGVRSFLSHKYVIIFFLRDSEGSKLNFLGVRVKIS